MKTAARTTVLDPPACHNCRDARGKNLLALVLVTATAAEGGIIRAAPLKLPAAQEISARFAAHDEPLPAGPAKLHLAAPFEASNGESTPNVTPVLRFLPIAGAADERLNVPVLASASADGVWEALRPDESPS